MSRTGNIATHAGVAALGTAPIHDTLGIPQEPLVRHETEASRNRALLQTTVESIQYLDKQAILGLQLILEHGEVFGFWLTPRKWHPAGKPATMNIDLCQRIVDFLPEELRCQVREADESRPSLHLTTTAGEVLPLPASHRRIRRILDYAMLTLTRYLILLRMGPAGIGQGSRGCSLDPTTIKTLAYGPLPMMWAAAVSKALNTTSPDFSEDQAMGGSPAEVRFLNRVEGNEFPVLSKSTRKRVLNEATRMLILAERACWHDVTAVVGAPVITDIKGQLEQPPEEEGTKKHLPLPDDYVGQMGIRSQWLIQELGPNLLAIASAIPSLWRQIPISPAHPVTLANRRGKAVAKFLSDYVWRDSQGRVIDALPFSLRLSLNGKQKAARSAERAAASPGNARFDDVDIPDADEGLPSKNWPPRSFKEIIGLLATLQGAHLFVAGLSMGARGPSETVNLQRKCVHYAPNGLPYANGRTFKLVERHDGEIREWILPDLAVQAIEQQARLVTLTEAIGANSARLKSGSSYKLPPEEAPTHLWGQIQGSSSDRTLPLLDITKALVSYAKDLGMDTAPGGQNMRSHRLRKTLARLVALALSDAPMVLKDVFGHKSIEMTLYYILTDKDLQVESERVSRELRVMRATKVVEDMVKEEDAGLVGRTLGGYGGPAALTVQRAIKVHRQRLHSRGEKWDAHSPVELAQILTMTGKAWQVVRRGVICTKFTGTESGPCNLNKGHPEPSRCRTHCQHRLEESFLREDVDGAIGDAIKGYQEAKKEDDLLTLSFWEGQIRLHVSRFADLRVKWMNDATVRSVVEQSLQGGVAA